ncbi:MAG: hypothetical protein H7A45_06400 [Verrucomicrobiales bacterium]|nr:hypothetical protein [Verrucomicrobiales bacterium]MCP5527624.1 hypothetical protein [Verrucomicrobiales bacterium]
MPESRSPTFADLDRELARLCGVTPAPVQHVFAPYRICPLGAHIDHQLGPVTAMAIDRGVSLAFVAIPEREVRLRSREFDGEVRFPITAPGPPRPGDWGNYARGAVQALTRAGHRLERGLAGVISGPWSEGGLSSSAAVGIACLLALEAVNRLAISPVENVRLDQAIENGYLGLRNGILDQSGILLSRRDHLTLIECATGNHELTPAPPTMPPWTILLAFSGLRRALVGTDYNRRVGECATAAEILLTAAGRPRPNARLGDVPEADYDRHKHRLPAALARRAAHFFSECDRVRRGVHAWRTGDLAKFGRLMTASGESSIHNYECGSPPLIDLFRLLAGCEGVYGTRFSGAGFRGCCVALVDPARADDVEEAVRREYHRLHPELATNAPIVRCNSADAARRPTGASEAGPPQST